MTRLEEKSAGVAGGESVSVMGERQPEVGGAGRWIDFFSHLPLSRPVPRNSGARFHSFPGPRFRSPPPIPRSESPVFVGHRLGPRFRELISRRECEFPAYLKC